MKKGLKSIIVAGMLGLSLMVGGAFIGGCSLFGGNNNTNQVVVVQDGISIHTNLKTTYYVGESLDVTGGIINYTVDGHTTQVAVTENMVTGFSSTTTGTRNMIITYQGQTTTVSYSINEIPAFLTTNSVYKSATTVDMGTGELSYVKMKYVVNGNNSILKFLMVSDNGNAYDNPNYEEWNSSYVVDLSLSKTFTNESWNATANAVIPMGSVNNATLTITMTNITEISFHAAVSYVASGQYDQNVNYECDMNKL